jgi:hypothetical protein
MKLISETNEIRVENDIQNFSERWRSDHINIELIIDFLLNNIPWDNMT